MSDKVEEKKAFFDNILNKIKTNKKFQYIIIFAMLAIVVFIFLFGFNSEKPKSISDDDQVLLYIDNLENKLSSVLSNVAGVGDVEVIITIESGKESVLAMKTTTKNGVNGLETETTPIIVNGKTVVVKEVYPKITGVLIVAKGANNISTMNRLQQATISLLDIDINQIEILTMN